MAPRSMRVTLKTAAAMGTVEVLRARERCIRALSYRIRWRDKGSSLGLMVGFMKENGARVKRTDMEGTSGPMGKYMMENSKVTIATEKPTSITLMAKCLLGCGETV